MLAGQAPYTQRVLSFYELSVSLNSTLFWRCGRKRMVRLYDEHVSARHLDIGVGTGLLMDRCSFPSDSPRITLMDLNPNSLAAASKRLSRYRPATHRASALEPFGLPERSFESIGLAYLLHCLPGAIAEKGIVFDHCREVLAPGGTVFGGTVLNGGVRHTALSRAAMRSFNRKRVFTNLEDDLDGLERVSV